MDNIDLEQVSAVLGIAGGCITLLSFIYRNFRWIAVVLFLATGTLATYGAMVVPRAFPVVLIAIAFGSFLAAFFVARSGRRNKKT